MAFEKFSTDKLKLAVIGGTGMSKLGGFEKVEEKTVSTPFGPPSSNLLCGKLGELEVVFLFRHGLNHDVMPSDVNFRANIYALKAEGCTHIVATTACGSLKEEYAPGQLVILDQFIDRTTKRKQTFFDGLHEDFQGVCHIPMAYPFNALLSKAIQSACENCSVSFQSSGTVVTIEGPRFSSMAESKLFRSWGADVINMTTVPEVVLASEAGMIYSAIAMVTDYDCWKEGDAVNVDKVMQTMKENSLKTAKVISDLCKTLCNTKWEEEIKLVSDRASASVM